MVDADLSRRLAGRLLDIGAVALSPDPPFTWASGRRAPIYCDNRTTLAFPRVRRLIADGFASALEAGEVRVDVVVGTATAGIPHAAWLADRLDLPMAYVRGSAKAHGRGNRIEGRVEPGARAVVVEDLISTGGSSLSVVEALREAGVEVDLLLAIFSYGLPEAAAAFAAASVPVHTLTTFDTLLEVARQRDVLPEQDVDVLLEWRQDPERWSESYGIGHRNS